MPLTRSERFALKSELSDRLRGDAEWTFDKQNLLLSEFGFSRLSDDYDSPGFDEIISTIEDGDLIEMYELVIGPLSELRQRVDQAVVGNWKPGYVRLFISHSASHREFAGEIADELAVGGVDGFVAHNAMEVSRPWQEQIEDALQSMQAFVALVHPEFNDSQWCQQEVGWALGRRTPAYFVRLDADPRGFPSREQWPSGAHQPVKAVASTLLKWVASLPVLGESLVEGLTLALADAGNYIDAGAAATRIASLPSLTLLQWNRLAEAYWSNDQAHHGILANRALQPLYERHDRAWPPEPRTTD